jgi:Ca-activated chloride channel family protein
LNLGSANYAVAEILAFLRPAFSAYTADGYMNRQLPAIALLLAFTCNISAQSGRATGYSESEPARLINRSLLPNRSPKPEAAADDSDVVRVTTDLVTIPVRITSRLGKPVTDVQRSEFKIFENGIEQEIAYFSNDEQPFTVVLVLDMSYSSVFKLEDIQLAARIFVAKLREHDRVMVVAFDEKPHILCEPTNDRRILRLAIDGAKIASGTALYDTLDLIVRERLSGISGRRSIVLLSDGVDTSSVSADAAAIDKHFASEDVIVYPVQYDTFDDVQKSRRKDAEIRFDEDDRPYVVQAPPKKGEREQDYSVAKEFFAKISEETGGRVYRVSSTTNLNDAFSNIANELRKVYSLGYYPSENRQSGATYDIKVRVYRPDLKITARNRYLGR